MYIKTFIFTETIASELFTTVQVDKVLIDKIRCLTTKSVSYDVVNLKELVAYLPFNWDFMERWRYGPI